MDDDWNDIDKLLDEKIIPLVIAAVEAGEFFDDSTKISAGEAYVQELLNGRPRRFQKAFRMPRYTYLKLEKVFKEKTSLKGSDTISIAQKFAMFMWVVGQGATNRDVQEQFQHSGDTVSRCFHQVLDSLFVVHGHYV